MGFQMIVHLRNVGRENRSLCPIFWISRARTFHRSGNECETKPSSSSWMKWGWRKREAEGGRERQRGLFQRCFAPERVHPTLYIYRHRSCMTRRLTGHASKNEENAENTNSPRFFRAISRLSSPSTPFWIFVFFPFSFCVFLSYEKCWT